jgi:hypothetical protein
MILHVGGKQTAVGGWLLALEAALDPTDWPFAVEVEAPLSPNITNNLSDPFQAPTTNIINQRVV